MQIEQVLVNLLRNAIDATKSVRDPEIDIILAAGETATLTVRDNGEGIRDLDSLFEPFYTTKDKVAPLLTWVTAAVFAVVAFWLLDGFVELMTAARGN